jgi:predicted HicB family RNase H-like nuclease
MEINKNELKGKKEIVNVRIDKEVYNKYKEYAVNEKIATSKLINKVLEKNLENLEIK